MFKLKINIYAIQKSAEKKYFEYIQNKYEK